MKNDIPFCISRKISKTTAAKSLAAETNLERNAVFGIAVCHRMATVEKNALPCDMAQKRQMFLSTADLFVGYGFAQDKDSCGTNFGFLLLDKTERQVDRMKETAAISRIHRSC